MPSLTVRFLMGASVVFLPCYYLQMVRSYTQSDFTQVVDLVLRGNLGSDQQEGYPVYLGLPFIGNEKLPISIAVSCPSPQPASIGFVDLRPESFLEGHRTTSRVGVG